MISGRSELAKAIRYARSRWTALTRYLDDGTLEISNNAAERAIRPLALGRKNYLFAGSDAGGERAAVAYTLIETAKLNGLACERMRSCQAHKPAAATGRLPPKRSKRFFLHRGGRLHMSSYDRNTWKKPASVVQGLVAAQMGSRIIRAAIKRSLVQTPRLEM